jgi:hypothetical protein
MGAPQQFKEDHMEVKNSLKSELKKTGIKILINVGIVLTLITLYYIFR